METKPMVLEICGDKKIQNPTDQQLRQQFDALDAKKGDAFVVLGATDLTYIQASGDKKTGFDLEYQDGNKNLHFRAKKASLTLDEILSAFSSYRDGKADWKQVSEWEKITW